MRKKTGLIYCLLLLLAACDFGGESAKPTISSFNIDSNEVFTNQEVRFRWSVSGEGSLECRLNPGDGSAEMRTDCAAGEQAHTYSEAGNYRATLTATDGQGQSTVATEEVEVQEGVGLPNQAPSASFEATPMSGDAPLEVTFDASGSSDPESDTLSYAWTFGDGGTGEGVQVTHTYSAAGEYEVMLTVDDGRGESDTQKKPLR